MNDLVKIKGNNNNIVLFLDDKAPFEEVVNTLFSMLSEALPLLSSNDIVINLGERKGLNPYLDNVIQKFKSLNLNLTRIIIEFNETKEGTTQNREISLEKDSGITVLRKTVRSGQKVVNEGDIIVFGDVNPGGEVISTGNVTILGDVRGVVHAGAKGNNKAYIVAYNLYPLQLRIGNYMIRGEDLSKKIGENINQVKIVYVDNGSFKITSDFFIMREVLHEG